MEKQKYRMEIIEYPFGMKSQFVGEVWINDRLEIQTTKMVSEANVITALNRRIREYNTMYNTRIPAIKTAMCA